MARFSALAAALALPSAVLAVPQWGQNGGNRARTGVSPVTWGVKTSADAEPVVRSVPGTLRTVQPLGAPYPITYTTVRAIPCRNGSLRIPFPATTAMCVRKSPLFTSPPPHTPTPPPSLQKVLQYEATLSSYPILSKTPCPVVLSDGTVVATLPAESTGTSPNIAVKLVNPDSGSSGGWSMIATADSGQATSTDPLSVDIVADDSDNTFLLVDDRNSALSGVDGFVVGWDSTLSPLSSWGGSGTINLQSNLRTLELYHMSATMGGSNSNGAQRLFMGLATLDSQRGLAIVSTDSSCSTDTSLCGANPAPPGPISGPTSCCLLSPKVSSTDIFAGVTGSAYLDGTGLLGLLTYSFNVRGAALAAFAEDGSVAWTTDGTRGGNAVEFKAHINQPNPTIDPFTKNVYWVGVLQSGEATQNRIYCVQTTGSNAGKPCPQFASADNGNPLNVQAAFNDVAGCVLHAPIPGHTGLFSFSLTLLSPHPFPLQHLYRLGLPAVYCARRQGHLELPPAAVLYHLLVGRGRRGRGQESHGLRGIPKPDGCVALFMFFAMPPPPPILCVFAHPLCSLPSALSSADGSMLDYYCIPRDMSSYFDETNYLATSPIVAKDARGAGQHTALVAQFDIIVFAFDPMNLKQGPLYAVDPFQDSGKEAATISTDYLALTAGGSVVCQGWDDTHKQYTIFAIPGILVFPSTNGGGGGGGASSGKTAAIAVSIVAVLAVGAGVWVWWVGGSAAALSILGSLPGVSTLLGKRGGAYGGTGYAGVGGSGAGAGAAAKGYGATGGAAASSASFQSI